MDTFVGSCEIGEALRRAEICAKDRSIDDVEYNGKEQHNNVRFGPWMAYGGARVLE